MMPLSSVIATVPAPNDNGISSGEAYTLSVDGYVTTKFASVGSDVEIIAMTRGHTDETIVTANILRYPVDPMSMLLSSGMMADEGVLIDRVVLTSTGVHEEDSDTMMWEGNYVVPVSSLGGVYGASIVAEDGLLRATDNPTQLNQILRDEVEKVLQAIDDGWDTAKPTMDIKNEFDDLTDGVSGHGGWPNFVGTASEGSGSGGSQQLWDTMIDAGHNQYNWSAGSNFLEALMVFLDSEDVDAAMAFVTGLLIYLDEFPLPRTFNDFPAVGEYLMAIDPIENFTRFEGTGDFEAAYNALLGSEEWEAMEEALENLIDNVKPFESFQIILHNIALLAVSSHPEAIIDGLVAYLQPLMEGDFDNMTPFQQLIVRFVEMAEHLEEEDMQDFDGDDIPDNIIWQYEKLMQTTEGQAWAAKMESDSPWVNDVFDDFDTLPEDIIEHLMDSVQHPVWGDVGETITYFVDWIDNATGVDRYMYWPNYDEGDDGEPGETEQSGGTVYFDELYDVSTSFYDPHVLTLGVELKFWGGDESQYPNSFPISMTNHIGETISTNLMQKDDDPHRYIGRLVADNIIATEWTFSQPMDEYQGDVENAELRMESLVPSMMEVMAYEGMDEQFIVSAIGVLVVQDETTSVSSPFTVSALTYDAYGPVEGAEVDIAVLRLSPQAAEDAARSLAPEGDIELTILASTSELRGRYTGSDLDGDVSYEIQEWGTYHDEEELRQHPQNSWYYDEGEGSGSLWEATIQGQKGIAEVTTSGTTDNGIEFSFMNTIPLPGTPGCARTWGNGDGSRWVNIGWEYSNFESEDEWYDKTPLDAVKINWGDGSDWWVDSEANDYGETNHEYPESDQGAPGGEEYEIQVQIIPEGDDNTITHWYTYKMNQGFHHEDDGEEWYEGWADNGGRCWLESDEDFIPSPQVIDSFITDGPFEVMKEEIYSSDADGKASMTVNPSLPGAYVTIVQSKYTREDGSTLTGLGMNLGAATEASTSVSGLIEVATIAGLPVWSATTGSSGLTTITVETTGLESTKGYTAMVGLAPIDLSVPFPNIDEDSWGEPEMHELEFQPGDTSRSLEIRLEAPVTGLVVFLIPEDAGEIPFPAAMSIGLVLNNPGELEMTGGLGPGQTTNIALSADDGVATRILAVAAPSIGFDPASLDFASFSELIYGEAVRGRGGVGWINAENSIDRVCEESDAWYEWREDPGQSNVRIKWTASTNDFSNADISDYDPEDAVLTDDGGNDIEPVKDWYLEEWDEAYYANYLLPDNEDEEGVTYTFASNSGLGLEYEFKFYSEEYRVEDGYGDICGGENDMTDEEIFDMFDDFFGSMNSVAWGIGSSADLHLPVLSSPQDNYTVIVVAQLGSGESATVMPALGTHLAVVNPQPPEMKNLTLGFSPANPKAGDTVTIIVTDDENQVVDGLSVILSRDNTILFGIVLNDTGQASFIIPSGTITLHVSGEMYIPYEITIIVDEDGMTTDDGEQLPADSDGDGFLDEEDDFPYDPDETTDTDGDGVGDNADAFPTDPDETADSDGDGIGDNAENDALSGSTDSNGSNNMMVIGGTVAAVLLLVIIILVTVMMRKGRGGDDDWDESADAKWDTFDESPAAFYDDSPATYETAPAEAPTKPSPGTVGEMRDGYEVIEYPTNSGSWWYKDSVTGQWMEWA